jgi:3-phosphoshikimate 1-carboxyvinyltransferase
MGPLIAALRAGGVTIRASSALSGLPFEIEGPLGPLDVALRADVSSQFVSALLLVLPTIPGTSRIRFLGTAVSFDYVRATVDILRAHGIKLTLTRAGTRVSGAQEYHGSYFEVPGDASSAAYLWAAAAATDGSVRVRGIDRTWRQADLAILPILRRMGARVELHSDGATVSGESLRGLDVDLTNSPDLYPLVAVLAAIARGRSRLLGASHVVFKESDRRAASAALVRSFGSRTAVSRGRLVIEHGDRLRPLRAGNFSDHRMVMAAAVGALAVAGRSRIGRAEEVRKSFPGFWKTLKLLGARMEANR